MNARAMIQSAITEAESRLATKQAAAADLAAAIRTEQSAIADLQTALATLPAPAELETSE